VEIRRSVASFELRASVNWAIALLGILGALTLFVSDDIADPYRRNQVQLFGILLYGSVPAAWLLDRWNSWVGRWFVVAVSISMIGLAHIWLGMSAALTLVAIPTGLAAVLISLTGATVTAMGETALLLLLSHIVPREEFGTTLVPLTMVWVMLGLMYAVYRPTYQLAQWSWDYYCRAQTLFEEARNRRAELEQALDDLTQANRQLALAGERMAVLREIAEEAQKAKTAFVASVSHEFRTPLNMIIGLVSLMMEAPGIYAVALSPKMREDLRVVHRNCEHLSDMINDVLDLTQLEASRPVLYRESVDVREVIDSCMTAVKPLLENKQLSLQVVVPDGLPAVHGDRTRIRQVILNLMSNAARFTEEGGISVEVGRQDRSILVSVADTGPGIAPEDVERIFEPFYQGRGALYLDKGGSGLGLSISRQFVKLHGGQMWLESELGAGTTFFFTLPISPPVAPVARPGHQIKADWVWRERAFRAGQMISTDQLTNPRIIICDEVGGLCSELEHYSDEIEFVDARDWIQAVRELRECPAHAMLFNTQASDGLWSLVEMVKQAAPDMPVLACSVPRSAERATEAGALGYLIKPVTRADLEGAIQAVGRPVRRILVVDDDPDVLRLFTRLLHVCDDALEVVTVSSGRQALDELRGSVFDLVFLDVVMPNMDGWRVLELVHQDKRMRGVPIFFVSAQDPADQPLRSPFLLSTIGKGLPLGKLLSCSLEMSTLLLKP
jgi:signal transduction histidine kinase/CheY-like chemotaxis protein